MRRSESAILDQLTNIRLDSDTIAAVVASLGASAQPIAIERGRVERQIRDLAMEHATEQIDDGVHGSAQAASRNERRSMRGSRSA